MKHISQLVMSAMLCALDKDANKEGIDPRNRAFFYITFAAHVAAEDGLSPVVFNRMAGAAIEVAGAVGHPVQMELLTPHEEEALEGRVEAFMELIGKGKR